jgi:DNA-binding response OmpR family regulator
MIRLMRAEGSRFIRTPVIVVSAYAGQNEIDEALAIGACRYLTKPVDFDNLLACISDIGSRPEIMEPVDCGCRSPLPAITNGDGD